MADEIKAVAEQAADRVLRRIVSEKIDLRTAIEDEIISMLGKMFGSLTVGGESRAKNLSPEQRKEQSRKAAEARWGKKNN